MKKHDEGYALILVLVVMIVMCLVAVTLMSFSLDNLQRQQDSVQHTKDQYAAQGEIEKIWVQLKAQADTIVVGANVEIQEDGTLIVKENTVVIRCKFDGVTISTEGKCQGYSGELRYASYTVETVEVEEGGGQG